MDVDEHNYFYENANLVCIQTKFGTHFLPCKHDAMVPGETLVQSTVFHKIKLFSRPREIPIMLLDIKINWMNGNKALFQFLLANLKKHVSLI